MSISAALHLVWVRGFELIFWSFLLLPPVQAGLLLLPLPPAPLLGHLGLEVVQVAPAVLLAPPGPLLTVPTAEAGLVARLVVGGAVTLERIVQRLLVGSGPRPAA